MKKKLLSMMMAVSMFFGMTPMSVFADNVIDTEEELISALEAGGEVTLGGDIELSECIYVDEDVIFDLNGYTVTFVREFDNYGLFYSEGDIIFGDNNPCNVVLKDSRGGGEIVGDPYTKAITINDSVCTIESGTFYNIEVYGGRLVLKGGVIGELRVGSNISGTYVEKKGTTKVETWHIYLATFNFDPTEYICTGYGVTNNGDGTYTTRYVPVQETGETYTIYYNSWSVEYNDYLLSDSVFQPEEILLNIYYVKGNASEKVVVPMTQEDPDAIYWSAEIDVAYKNAMITFEDVDAGCTTKMQVTPDMNGVVYSADYGWGVYLFREKFIEIFNEILAYDVVDVTENDKTALLASKAKIDELYTYSKYIKDDEMLMLKRINEFLYIRIDAISLKRDNVIDTVGELKAAINMGGAYVFGSDIELSECLFVHNDMELDFNGHTITNTEYYDEATDEYTIGSIVFGDAGPCNIILKDTRGGGGIVGDGDVDGVTYIDQAECIIESGIFSEINIYGGQLLLNGGEIGCLSAWKDFRAPYVQVSDSAEVKEWNIDIATFNFDPTEYLYTGYGVIDNGDGTYTTKYVPVEETGETYTIYFYNWISEDEQYFIGDYSNVCLTSVSNLVIEIMFVKGNEYEVVEIPMTKLDEDGKYWSAEVDVAYKNAQMHIWCPEIGVGTYYIVLPDKDGAMYSHEFEWTIYGMDEAIDELAGKLGAYNETTVTEDDKTALQTIIAKVNELLAEDGYLTDRQKEKLNAIKTKAQTLLLAIDVEGGTPNTGDYTNVMIWMVVMAMGASIFVATKKNKRIEN